MVHDLLGQLTRRNETFVHNSLTPQQLGEIIDAVEEGRITVTGGKILMRHLLDAQKLSPEPSHLLPAEESITGSPSIADLIKVLGLSKSTSMNDLDQWCQEVIDRHPDQVGKVQAGKHNVLMFLVGRVMKLSQGRADAVLARGVLEKKLTGRESGSTG